MNALRDFRGELLALDDFPDWDGRIADFPQKRIFHESVWLRFLEKDQRGRAVVIRLADAGGGERALWPGVVVRKGPVRIFGSPLRGWGTVAMGPLYHEVDSGGLLAAAEAALVRAGIHHWEFVSESLPTEEARERGYRLERSPTHRISLDPDEERMWEHLQHRCRKSIRKAMKNGLTCRLAEDGRFLGDMYRMVLEVFSRSRITPSYDLGRLTRLWDTLQPRGNAFGMEVFLGERRLAAALFLTDRRQIYGWSGASDSRFKPLCPNNLLYWETMRHSAAIGATHLHLPGAPGSSIGKFKASFNPDILDYPFWILDRSRFLRLGRRLFKDMAGWRARLVYWVRRGGRIPKPEEKGRE